MFPSPASPPWSILVYIELLYIQSIDKLPQSREASLENEGSLPSTDVTMRQAHEIRTLVKMEVAVTHICITSVRGFLQYMLTRLSA